MTKVPLSDLETVKRVLGKGGRSSENSLPNVPSFHPKGRLTLGIRGRSHRGHTHTTRRQIIQDTILTVFGMAPKRQPEGRSLRNWRRSRVVLRYTRPSV